MTNSKFVIKPDNRNIISSFHINSHLVSVYGGYMYVS